MGHEIHSRYDKSVLSFGQEVELPSGQLSLLNGLTLKELRDINKNSLRDETSYRNLSTTGPKWLTELWSSANWKGELDQSLIGAIHVYGYDAESSVNRLILYARSPSEIVERLLICRLHSVFKDPPYFMLDMSPPLLIERSYEDVDEEDLRFKRIDIQSESSREYFELYPVTVLRNKEDVDHDLYHLMVCLSGSGEASLQEFVTKNYPRPIEHDLQTFDRRLFGGHYSLTSQIIFSELDPE